MIRLSFPFGKLINGLLNPVFLAVLFGGNAGFVFMQLILIWSTPVTLVYTNLFGEWIPEVVIFSCLTVLDLTEGILFLFVCYFEGTDKWFLRLRGFLPKQDMPSPEEWSEEERKRMPGSNIGSDAC